MRFFHLSDLHIGLKLYNRDLSEDQAYILDQIARRAGEEKPDAVVIAGDIYDKAVPAAEAVALFDRFVQSLREAVPDAALMMISGNHDSAPRVDLYRHLLQRQGIHMIGMPPRTRQERIEKVTLRDAWGEVDFYLLPFVKPAMVRDPDREETRKEAEAGDESAAGSYEAVIASLLEREQIDPTRRSVLVSHQFYLPEGKTPAQVERMETERRTVGDIDAVSASLLAPFDYAALGHIHKPMKVGAERLRYCGTPLACSVSEAGQQKSILLVELKEKGNLRVRELPLQPLRQVRIIRGSLEQVLAVPSGDYVSVVLTDRADLEVTDMRDRLNHAFPCLLEIRREIADADRFDEDREGEALSEEEQETDPFALCRAFLGEVDTREEAILRGVVNRVWAREVEA